jgi:ADP-ribose pyrophosphatase YjhB (NUDIX family)
MGGGNRSSKVLLDPIELKKLKNVEIIEDTAIRECLEEICVEPKDPKRVAILNFYFPDGKSKLGFDQQVHVFISFNWTGKPTETEEMKPKWFGENSIPYSKMWSDDKNLATESISRRNLQS